MNNQDYHFSESAEDMHANAAEAANAEIDDLAIERLHYKTSRALRTGYKAKRRHHRHNDILD